MTDERLLATGSFLFTGFLLFFAALAKGYRRKTRVAPGALFGWLFVNNTAPLPKGRELNAPQHNQFSSAPQDVSLFRAGVWGTLFGYGGVSCDGD